MQNIQPCTRVWRRPLHGVLLLDKPKGLSSNQALQKARFLLRAEKAGHTGTLDPFATGVLPLCFGAATKFSQTQLVAHKRYRAYVQLGVRTDTGDSEGSVLSQVPIPADWDKRLYAVQQRFIGAIRQIPPMYSAVKKDGKALYKYARAGQTVERSARSAEIFDLCLMPVAQDRLFLDVHCSKGTYIRTLAEDIGQTLGTEAYVLELDRSQSGVFEKSSCVDLEALSNMPEGERLQFLLPCDSLLQDFTRITLEAAEAARFLSGMRRRGHWPDCAQVAVYGENPHALLGSAHCRARELIPGRLLNPLEIRQVLAQNGQVNSERGG